MAARRPTDPAKTRRQICRAAISVFAELGFHGASYEKIATRAKVRKSLVQYHFPSKEELWHEAFAEKLKPMLDLMDESLAASGEFAMEKFTVARFRFLLANDDASRLLSWIFLDPDLIPRPVIQRMGAILARVGSKIKGHDPRVFFAMLTGAMDGWFRLRQSHADLPFKITPELDDLFLRELLIRFFGPKGPSRGGLA